MLTARAERYYPGRHKERRQGSQGASRRPGSHRTGGTDYRARGLEIAGGPSPFLSIPGLAAVSLIVAFATVVAVCAAAPLGVLAVQCWLSLLPLRRHGSPQASATPRIAVVVPAHNEEDRIATAVTCIRNQVGADVPLFVIADNCDDATAERAQAAGANGGRESTRPAAEKVSH